MQQCTETHELPACWQCDVLPVLFPRDRAWCWWSCPASRTNAGYPVWLCPALWYLSHLLFQRRLSFSLLLHRAWMCPGMLHAHVSQKETWSHSIILRFYLAWPGYFPLVYGVSGGGSDHPWAVSSAGTNQKNSSGIVLGFTCWEPGGCPQINFVTV